MGFRNRRAYYTRCKTTGEELPRLLVITQEGYNVLLELESGVKVWEKNVRVGGEKIAVPSWTRLLCISRESF